MPEHAPLLRGSKLPLVLLCAVPADVDAPLIAGRGPQVIVTMHPTNCAICRGYVHEVATGLSRYDQWGGRLVVVVAGPIEAARPIAAELDGTARVLADPEGKLTAWGSSVVVADEWGEVFFAVTVSEQHALPTPEELGEWTAFVAIQCEECEMPEGGWKTL